MRHVFSTAGEQALRALLRRPALLAFDFDGTLAPIVLQPGHARAPSAVAQQLARLARRCPVAIVTGRSVADVRPRLGFTPQYLVGNHGAEGLDWPPPGNELDAARALLREQAATLAAAGVQTEDKGQSLALHFRQAPDPMAAQQAIARLQNLLPDTLRSFGGKRVLNIVPRAAPDKADAVLALLRLSGCASLLFAGDDANDEVVFERAPPDWVTVRVGRLHGKSAAMFRLERPAQMHGLLERLLQILG